MNDFVHRVSAEAPGTALLVAAVVGSGIMAERPTSALTVQLSARHRPEAVAAYWLTASTSFANPVMQARALTDSFSGIRPMDAPALIVEQLPGALLASGVSTWLVTIEKRA